MLQIMMLKSSVYELVETYDKYMKLLGAEIKPEDDIDMKVNCAIVTATTSLKAECLQLEAEEKRRRDRMNAKGRTS